MTDGGGCDDGSRMTDGGGCDNNSEKMVVVVIIIVADRYNPSQLRVIVL